MGKQRTILTKMAEYINNLYVDYPQTWKEAWEKVSKRSSCVDWSQRIHKFAL